MTEGANPKIADSSSPNQKRAVLILMKQLDKQDEPTSPKTRKLSNSSNNNHVISGQVLNQSSSTLTPNLQHVLIRSLTHKPQHPKKSAEKLKRL